VHWLQHLRDDIGFRGWRFDFAKVRWSTRPGGGMPAELSQSTANAAMRLFEWCRRYASLVAPVDSMDDGG